MSTFTGYRGRGFTDKWRGLHECYDGALMDAAMVQGRIVACICEEELVYHGSIALYTHPS